MAVNSSNDKGSNEEGDDSKKNINHSKNQKRKYYTYIGFAFTIPAVVSITYLVMTLYGPLQPPLLIYDSIYNEREFRDSQIEQIAKHEIGHVLGLGHANFDGNLMAVQVHRGSGSVDDCEIEAVYKANEWWFEKSDDYKLSYIQPPTTEHVECKPYQQIAY
jgi:hypothetical protein